MIIKIHSQIFSDSAGRSADKIHLFSRFHSLQDLREADGGHGSIKLLEIYFPLEFEERDVVVDGVGVVHPVHDDLLHLECLHVVMLHNTTT